MKQGDHIFLVDGSGYIFRAYHALPPLTRKSDGLPCGAVSGFCNMLWRLLCDAKAANIGRSPGRAKADQPDALPVPSHFAVIFDYSSETFRKKIYPEYKAHRPPPPADLIPQFGLIRAATRAFNLPCIEREGYEADDILATYARMAEQAGADATIISSDKDLMQLVGPHIGLYDPMREKRTGPREVEEKWGVPPRQMVDFQALVGDSVDNVPGVAGIGPKTAAELLQRFGSLEQILARTGEISQKKRRESLEASAAILEISRKLVKLCVTVPLDLDLDALALMPPDAAKIIGFLKAMEFNALTRRVAKEMEAEPQDIEPSILNVQWDKAAHSSGAGGQGGGAANAGGAGLSAAGGAGGQNSGGAANAQGGGGADTASLAPYDNPAAAPQYLAAHKCAQAKSAKIDRSAYQILSKAEDLRNWLAEARRQGFMAFDTETDALDPLTAHLVGFSLALQAGKAAYVPLAHIQGEADLPGELNFSGKAALQPGQMEKAEALALLKPILEDESILKIGQNMKYDGHIMAGEGINLRCFDDTMLMAYVLGAGMSAGFGMDALAEQWLNHKTISFSDVVGSGRARLNSFAEAAIDKASEYAAEDADVTLRLWQVLKPQLAARELAHIYEREERPLAAVLARMEARGILIDKNLLAKLSRQFGQEAEKQAQAIYALAGEKFNIGSPKQLGDILFGKFSLPGGRKTKTGQWSTSAQVLDDLAAQSARAGAAVGELIRQDLGETAEQQTLLLAEQAGAAANEETRGDAGGGADGGNPSDLGNAAGGQKGRRQGYALAGEIVAWRQLKKLQSTYTDALPQFCDSQGRVHTNYALAATTTGRLASSEPNLQNIPVRTKEGRLIRAAFIAPEGKLLLSADYSQIELRILAHVADIAALKNAFAQNMDIHAMTASEMFDVPLAEMTPEIRRRAKAINFGIIYGISAFGLANQLGIGREEAGHYINKYFERFPGIRNYMEETKAFARQKGYVETIFGRRIHYPQITSANAQIRAFNERAAINAPIQGAAADIIRRAMIFMESGLQEAGLSAQMLCQVHDELIFEVAEAEAEKAQQIICPIMEKAALPAVSLSVPLRVEARAAKNWNDAH